MSHKKLVSLLFLLLNRPFGNDLYYAQNLTNIIETLPQASLGECGVSKNAIQAKIINGEIVPDHKYPWVVSLRRYDGSSISSHFCAGKFFLCHMSLF